MAFTRGRTLPRDTFLPPRHERDRVARLHRIAAFAALATALSLVALSAQQLKPYMGKFYSADLDVTYEILGGDSGSLRLQSPGGDANLDFVVKDEFAGPGIGAVKFTCTGEGPCNALTIDVGRASNLQFVRVPTTTVGAKPGG